VVGVAVFLLVPRGAPVSWEYLKGSYVIKRIMNDSPWDYILVSREDGKGEMIVVKVPYYMELSLGIGDIIGVVRGADGHKSLRVFGNKLKPENNYSNPRLR
jgi:hypothetical protein